jgi:hypothetical protein
VQPVYHGFVNEHQTPVGFVEAPKNAATPLLVVLTMMADRSFVNAKSTVGKAKLPPNRPAEAALRNGPPGAFARAGAERQV